MQPQDIISFLIPLLFPLIVAFAAAGYQYLMQRSPRSTHSLVASIAQTAVLGIEQAAGDVIGTHKKQVAVQQVETILAAMHINVPTELVDLSIEMAVYAINEEERLWQPRPRTDPALPANITPINPQ